MATAMAFPEAKRGMHSELKNLTGSAKVYLSQARFVLRNSPMVEGDRYPGRCLDVMNGLISLTEAYELAQQDFRNRAEKERIDQEIAAKRADLEACRSSIQ
jgi:hypothetical protein